MKTKILSILGLCKRANRLVSGEGFALEKIKSNKAKLVFLASDAGVNTTKRIKDKSSFYNVFVIDSFSTDELSKAIGKNNRKVIVVTDSGFAKKIMNLL
ncbi:MAG: YlxQ-related RNA-binding protein [Candidatus Izimaplasma sp.]|nr:YlxQ-related RNA-binding protein [Candidatus Izimaplasma bacterium]